MIAFRWNNPAYMSIFTDAPFPVDQVIGVTIDMGSGQHDMAKLRCSGLSPAALSALDQMPMLIEWGSNVSTRMQFAGYVSVTGATYEHGTTGISRGLNPSQLKEVVVTCLGATTAMRDGGRDLWQQRSVPQVVNDIATKYRFSVDCAPHNFLWPRLAMNGASYWQFLNQTASMIGFDLIGHGTHLRLIDPATALASSSGIPLLQTRQTFRGLNSGGTLMAEFRPRISAHTGTAHAGAKIITGLDTNTGKTFTLNTAVSTQDDTGFGTDKLTSMNTLAPVVSASSYSMASALAQGIDRQMLWTTTASVTTMTGVDVAPGNVVYVDGFSADFDGLWYVTSTSHDVHLGSYTVKLELGKDALGAPLVQPKPAEAYQRVPSSLLLNGRWVASAKQVVPSNA